MMLPVVVACVAAAAAAELHANPPLTAATPNRTRVHADAALLLAGLDWAGEAPDNATVAPIIRRHPLVVAFLRTKRLVGRVPKLYRWLTRLVNPRPVEPPPPPPPEPVAAPATAPPVYDAGAALDAYARSCARYAVHMSGELRDWHAWAARFERRVIAPAGGASAVDLYVFVAADPRALDSHGERKAALAALLRAPYTAAAIVEDSRTTSEEVAECKGAAAAQGFIAHQTRRFPPLASRTVHHGTLHVGSLPYWQPPHTRSFRY